MNWSASSRSLFPRFNVRMLELTRPPIRTPPTGMLAHLLRRCSRRNDIAERTGNPHDTEPSEWACGVYPGSHPGEHQSDTAATSTRPARISSAHGRCSCRSAPRPIFKAWREQRDWTERKYARCGMLAGGWSRQAMDRASLPIAFGSVPAVRCSTCTAPRRC